jgi:hypothetical protein
VTGLSGSLEERLVRSGGELPQDRSVTLPSEETTPVVIERHQENDIDQRESRTGFAIEVTDESVLSFTTHVRLAVSIHPSSASIPVTDSPSSPVSP